MAGSIGTGVGLTRLVATAAGLLSRAWTVVFHGSTLPHDSRQSRRLSGSVVALATVTVGGSVETGFTLEDGIGLLTIAVSVQGAFVQGAFDLNSRPMKGCRIGDGVLLTHDDWLHGLHGLQQVLHCEQSQLQDFGSVTVPAANGTRRDGHEVVQGAGGHWLPWVWPGEYCTCCVFLGVWVGDLAGETELDVETTTGGVGFLRVRT